MARHAGRSGTSGQAGFTLIELLIAMTLLGLIFAALTGALRFGTQAWRAGAERAADSDDLEVVHTVLRRQFAAVLDAGDADDGTDRPIMFHGTADSIRFIAAAPSRGMTPGLFRLTLGLRPDGRGQALVMSWRRLGQAPVGNDDSEPLVRGISGIKFSYFGLTDRFGTAKWVDEWGNSLLIPYLVRVDLTFIDPRYKPWPSLIFPVGVKAN